MNSYPGGGAACGLLVLRCAPSPLAGGGHGLIASSPRAPSLPSLHLLSYERPTPQRPRWGAVLDFLGGARS
jgi:hypothetical protein